MAYQIVKKKRFLNKLIKVLTFLEKEWGHNVATAFLEKTDSRIELLSFSPFTGAPSGIRDTRSLLVTKHNRIFYKIVDNKVIVLNLYDTRKKYYQDKITNSRL